MACSTRRTVVERIHGTAGPHAPQVDVERAELDVLRGVGDCWPLVRQAVLEVHQENLPEVLQVLRRDAGFRHILVEEDALLKGSGIHNVFCRR